MTREDMIEKIRAIADPEFKSEIAHHMGIDREDDDGITYDEVSALFDIEQRCEDWLADATTATERKWPNHLLKIARAVMIEIGFYRVMSQDEIDNTYTSSGLKPWAFKLNGSAYTTDEIHEEWMWGAQS